MNGSAAVVAGLARVPVGSTKVNDADEEVFLLYTRLATKPTADGSEPFGGLGYVDNNKPNITVRFELRPKRQGSPTTVRKVRNKKRLENIAAENEVLVEVALTQDTTALRSRKGDTGSVLWRLSVCFAQVILQHYHFDHQDALFDRAALSGAHVLELGAGTGLLSIVLSPLVRRYTATDIAELIPLIRKNISLNIPRSHVSNITVEELDWVRLKDTLPARRSRLFAYPTIDLLLVVDCIYHPNLLLPLVETINHLTVREKTVVVVAVELRAEDVVREFLELLTGSEKGWEIWSVGEHLLDAAYAIWVGWKRVRTSETD